MPIGVRTRFETFKRDKFTCRYCGRTTPAVVLEVDHIVPTSQGGTDDPINLTTSCWECNRGKSGVPLSEVMTGEDSHDRALLILETERQLREYNTVLAARNERIEQESEALFEFWSKHLTPGERTSIRNALERHSSEVIYQAMRQAIENGRTRGLAYVHACLNRWSKKDESAA